MLSVGHLYETTARLAYAVNGAYPSSSFRVRPAYVRAINTLRPPELPAELGGIKVGYEDSPWVAHCKTNGIFAHIVGPATASDGPTREEWDRQIIDALDLIRKIHPGLRQMVDLVVTDIIAVNSGADGGGSANTMPGIVLMSPGAGWGVLDYAMCIVHEALHSSLFIMDTVYGMFTLPPAELEKDEHCALSAVKIGQKRPLHAAFHAAAVAVPLMYMEYREGGGELVTQYTTSLRDACKDMQTSRGLFTSYGRLLLDEMSRWAEADPIDFSQVARAITSREFAGYQPEVAA
ncbi:HEXXH motif-containing putative peptide modification protein [Streptomyces sp. NPDC050610]|uniref:aKG-HExxH-type peptide beta-hydroxylase n=1 Tax=Streptomyces sp. NPDC050610 TaxID=3157097 RepID=UPI003418EA23